MSTTTDNLTAPLVHAAFCALPRALMFAAFAIGDDIGSGAVLVRRHGRARRRLRLRRRRRRRSAGLGGPGRDERWELIDLRATAITGGS